MKNSCFSILLILIVITLTILFAGCNAAETSASQPSSNSGGGNHNHSVAESAEKNGYDRISQEEAKLLMDTESDYIIVDTRTESEFAQGHIDGAVLIPEFEIKAKADELLPNKDQLILVYCRTGRRSKIAAQYLADMGYTNVKEFGGIVTWEYGTVK